MSSSKITWKKIWDFLWNDNSIWSWIVNIILAFVLIKFILYPGLGFALGTNLPIVAVISESMEHNGDFEKWWNSSAYCGAPPNYTVCKQSDWYMSKGISEEEFRSFHMKNGFNKGDIIILKGVTYEKAKVGDVIVFQSKLAYPVIHRVVEKGDLIQTKGDNNKAQLETSLVNEKYISKDQLIGKAWFKIPFLGYVKILFVQFIQCMTFNGCEFG